MRIDPETGEVLPPKKRTRRGTRGGRNRKKKPVVAGEAAAERGSCGGRCAETRRTSLRPP